MASIQQVTVASSAQDGSLLTVDLQTAWNLATQGAAALESVINQALLQAEQNAPEGALLELDVTGWTIPILGTSVGNQVANQVNRAWANGQITYPSGPEQGLSIAAWPPQYWSGPFAAYDAGTDTIAIRAVKQQGIVVTVILIILGVMVGLAILNLILGIFGKQFSLRQGIIPKTPTPPVGTPAGWWARLPLLDKIGIVGGGLGLVAFGIYVYGEEKIHAAGAAHSAINIINEPTPPP